MKKKEKESPREEIRRRVTLASTASVEMEERKSVFIGHAAPVKDEEEARAFLEEKRRAIPTTASRRARPGSRS